MILLIKLFTWKPVGAMIEANFQFQSDSFIIDDCNEGVQVVAISDLDVVNPSQPCKPLVQAPNLTSSITETPSTSHHSTTRHLVAYQPVLSPLGAADIAPQNLLHTNFLDKNYVSYLI